MIVVGFAGGGGTCRGIEKGLGRGPDLAINHDRDAIEMHRINHPACRHIMSDILGVDPVKATRGRPVGLAWFSPDCTHFSQAKGGTPVKKEIRDLAWVVIRWAKEVSPDVIMLENVREFMTWGPLIQQVKGGVPQSYPDGSPKM
ncbi:MAG: cytosine methyltransferase, partial [Phycisphaerales bacterium]|nr:cytosine methyltransferase [Phycisphaerales bacterium]